MTEDKQQDRRLAWALARYQVISAYLAADPPRGQRAPLRRQLAERTWTDPDGEPMTVAAETIRKWLYRYRKKGLDGLMDGQRPTPGIRVLTTEQMELLCRLKREVPERSIERLIEIAEQTQLVAGGKLRRSTVHRVLQAQGLSARKLSQAGIRDLDRFEAENPNDLWQSDLLVGPWLPDPDRPGHMKRAHLYAFLDDHSRLLLHGRFSFKENLPQLELVFRRALQKHGLCRRVYYDNAQVYRSGHMKQIIAALGVHRIIFTKAGRPMGHGKIEAFNRFVKSAFIAELKASRIKTLDALNEAFVAWADLQYNRRVHSETNQAPIDRWRAGADKVVYVDDEQLRQAFLWRERRTPDKTGVFSLLGIRYQVGCELARKQVEVRFDPEERHEVEVWHNRTFVQRARPLDILSNRRPHQSNEMAAALLDDEQPAVDWLAHLVSKRRIEGFIEPDERQLADQARATRDEANDTILHLLQDYLSPDVVDAEQVLDWLAQYGPLDPQLSQHTLERLTVHGQCTDLHVHVVLDTIRKVQKGESS